MELLIQDKTTNQLRGYFVIEVEFMFGDADGEETLTFPFSKDQYDSNSAFKTEVHDFIRSIQEAIKLDSKGRGGFESSKEALNWYGLGIDTVWENHYLVEKQVNTPVYQWGRFCEDYVYATEEGEREFSLSPEEVSPTFLYCIPTYSDGWYASYQEIRVFYYDKEGYKYDVKIKK